MFPRSFSLKMAVMYSRFKSSCVHVWRLWPVATALKQFMDARYCNLGFGLTSKQLVFTATPQSDAACHSTQMWLHHHVSLWRLIGSLEALIFSLQGNLQSDYHGEVRAWAITGVKWTQERERESARGRKPCQTNMLHKAGQLSLRTCSVNEWEIFKESPVLHQLSQRKKKKQLLQSISLKAEINKSWGFCIMHSSYHSTTTFSPKDLAYSY